MNPIIVFYLLASSIHTAPLVVITLSLHYDTPIRFYPKKLIDKVNCELRRNKTLRFEQLLQIFNLDSKECLAKFCLVALLLHLLTMTLIVMAVFFDVPLPFISDTDDSFSLDIMNDLLKFSALIGCVELIPMVFIVLALFYDLPLRFLPNMSGNSAPPNNENTHEEDNFEDPTSIRLTRFEDEENTIVNANCEDQHLGELFKIVVFQGKKPGAVPQCFLYLKSGTTLEEINPAPVTVHQLDQMISPDENTVSV